MSCINSHQAPELHSHALASQAMPQFILHESESYVEEKLGPLEHLCVLASELNDIAVDLYLSNNMTLSLEFLKEALEATLIMSPHSKQPKKKSFSAKEDLEKRLLSKIVLGKETLQESEVDKTCSLDMYCHTSCMYKNLPFFLPPRKIGLQRGKDRNNKHLNVATILFNMGLVGLHQGNVKSSIEFLEMAKNILMSGDSWNKELAATILNTLGSAIEITEAYDKAIETYSHAELICRNELLLDIDPMSIRCITEILGSVTSNLGRIYYNQGDFESSTSKCWETIKYRREALGDDSAQVSATMYNIGLIYQTQEKYNEAIEFYQFFLDRAAMPNRNEEISYHDIVTVLVNILLIHCKRLTFSNRTYEVQQSLKKLQISRCKSNIESPNIPGLLSHIGNTLTELSLYQYAIPFFYEKLRVEKIFFGSNHAQLAPTLNSIGQSYLKQLRFSKAMCYFNQARSVLNKFVDMSLYAHTTYNLGMSQYHLGNHNEAMLLFDEAIQIQRKALGEYHPDIAEMSHNIGIIQLETGRVDDALSNLMVALLIRRMVFGNDHCNVSESLYKVAQIHNLRGEHKEALNVYQETLRIERKNLGDFSIDVAITLRNIGHVYHSLGDLERSIEAFHEVIEILQSILGENHKVIASIYNTLGSICIESGKSQAANKFYAEFKRITEITQDDIDLNDSVESEFEQKILAVFGSTVEEIHPPCAAAA